MFSDCFLDYEKIISFYFNFIVKVYDASIMTKQSEKKNLGISRDVYFLFSRNDSVVKLKKAQISELLLDFFNLLSY